MSGSWTAAAGIVAAAVAVVAAVVGHTNRKLFDC